MQSANAELEQHAAERRRALHEVADRLRKRERDLQEIAEREGNEAAQRIQISIGDVERRQVEQLQRIVGRETQRYAEAATMQFDTQIKTAREEAARRLSRELDLAVERFAREAEGVLTERLNHVSDAAAHAGRGAARAPARGAGAPARRRAPITRGSRSPGGIEPERTFARDRDRCRGRAGRAGRPAARTGPAPRRARYEGVMVVFARQLPQAGIV